MAIFLSNVALAIIMMTVITKDQILDDIIIGMPEKEMLEVFAELTDQSRINYYTEERNSPMKLPSRGTLSAAMDKNSGMDDIFSSFAHRPLIFLMSRV